MTTAASTRSNPEFARVQRFIDSEHLNREVEIGVAIADFLVRAWNLIAEPRPATQVVVERRSRARQAAAFMRFAPK